jgi:hypothetical protein
MIAIWPGFERVTQPNKPSDFAVGFIYYNVFYNIFYNVLYNVFYSVFYNVLYTGYVISLYSRAVFDSAGCSFGRIWSGIGVGFVGNVRLKIFLGEAKLVESGSGFSSMLKQIEGLTQDFAV